MDLESGIIQRHSEGKSNRQIAREVNLHWNTVGKILERNGLKSNYYFQSLKKISETEARCSECDKVLPLSQFQFGRKDTQYEYQFSYCNNCRNLRTNRYRKSTIKINMKVRLDTLRRKAKQRQSMFDLPDGYLLKLWESQAGLCFYTDLPMIWDAEGIQPNSISIDKIVPERGYIVGNVVLCCNRINTMKNNVSLEEMREWMPGWFDRIQVFQVGDPDHEF